MGCPYGITQTEDQSHFLPQVTPAKQEKQEGIQTRGQAGKENQKPIAVAKYLYKGEIDQMKQGKPLFPFRFYQELPKGVLDHQGKGAPIIPDKKERRAPEQRQR